jgi:sugar lactone lactonase YvrE
MARTPLHARRWRPPADRGRTGAFAPTAALPLTRLAVPGPKPEDVAIDATGRVVAGLADGRVVRVDPASGEVAVLADTGGRPLGIEVDGDGTLVVCDTERGLLRVDPGTGQVHELVTRIAGRPLRFTNNAAVARDGTIYFSDSSERFGLAEFKGDLLAHSDTGRLLRRSPDGSVDVLLDGLAFANGVALAPDESFVLVAETGGYRVTRLDLTGPAQGRARPVAENLPGLPDNLSTGSDGRFWMAMPSTRNRLLDRLLPGPGWLRSAVWALPERLQPEADRVAWAVAIDGEGTVLTSVDGPADAYHYVTGVREHEGRLYLGSLGESAVGVLTLP